jgi:NAD(P)H-hydrate epimerase
LCRRHHEKNYPNGNLIMQTITSIPVLPPRPVDSHKGTFGKVLIIAGSVGFSGAASLAGQAALRGGAGLVRVAVPRSILPIVASLDPCYTTIPLPEDENGQIASEAVAILVPHLADNDIVAVGPGLGQDRGARELLSTLIVREGLKLVIDADGLNVLAKTPDWIGSRKASVVLTPHPGEMKRLWDSAFREPVPGDHKELAIRFAALSGCIVVLKGADTVVADSSRVYVNTTGNPGMATAGAGDVLTGLIAALAGQGVSLFDAAVLGVYLHGMAGDLAAQIYSQVSLIATDIIHYLPAEIKRYLNAAGPKA